MNNEIPKAQTFDGLTGLDDFVKKNSDYIKDRYEDSGYGEIKLEEWNEFLSFLKEKGPDNQLGCYVQSLQSNISDELRMSMIGSHNESQMEPLEGMYRTIDLPIESDQPKPPLRIKFFENGRITFGWGPGL